MQEIKVHKHIAPTQPGEWTIKQIEEVLSRPLPESMLKTKTMGGTRIKYIPWHILPKILSKYCPGWQWEIKSIYTTEKDLFVIGKLSIPTAEGMISREATGTESLDCNSYGDASSNSEAMAMRRCCSKFGLGLYLYEK